MADEPYDFAVIGSTPLCGLLAGLLATSHGKRVVLIAEPQSPFRLPRGYDLSVAPLTRPETWALLKRTSPVVLKLLTGLGKGLFRRIDPLFVARGAAAIEALAHMRHVAAGYGHAIEREAAEGAAYRFRDAALLDRFRVAAAVTAWLVRSGVLEVRAGDAQLSFRRDGSLRIETKGVAIEALHAILGDDPALLAHLGRGAPGAMRVETVTSLLTQPVSALAAPIVLHADSGVALLQRSGGAVTALAPGADAVAAIGAALTRHGPVRKAGQVSFRAFATLDGAALLGIARAPKATILTGLGPIGAFLAPALARFIVGTASDDEMRYFSAREIGKGRTQVAEFTPVAGVPA